MKILSLDLSTKSTGYAYGQDQKLQGHGCITSSSLYTAKRIIKMREQIAKIIKQNNIEKVIMQEVLPQFNTRTTKVLMWIQGVIITSIYEINPKIQCEFMIPAQWRAAIKLKQGKGIKREKLKQQDMDYVFNKYNLKVNDDEADAICIFDAYNIKDKEKNEINWG